MNEEQVLGNEASAANQEIRRLISDPFPGLGARIFLTTCNDIYPNFLRPFKLNFRPQIRKMSKIKTF